MRRVIVVGVMGPGEGASEADRDAAYRLGEYIGSQGWVVLNGGRKEGVMNMVNLGARDTKGLTIGIHPQDTRQENPESVILPIVTGMGNARNCINVLSSDIVVAVAFHVGAGTTAEVALAVKAGKPVLLITENTCCAQFFKELSKNQIRIFASVEQAIPALEPMVKAVLGDQDLIRIWVS